MSEDCKEFYFVITEDMEDWRVDKCLSELIDSLSRSYIQKLISNGGITVNDKPPKASYRVKAEDKLRVIPPLLISF